ncbi:hypothetical protein HBI56_053850 [Parastagonospora nodorum]|uniref:Uncharacterized protein n=2 Tax=Phaeosphaeria nodorum (strain SN15 / ATCC MYA-4574 / FGSC 10173) TaxID=321614 RepID=A0A7U2ICL3_PHANO|nr:hypothetical protein HBH56_098230 [Parastagonospora nodorum]QRD07361.1 hypothetical protein JI435_132440 [Parastagonospora nodorum SN15]KAH3930387.1 hypothetical protein HBH54_112550 [Parastagonospora nodorum]KAH4022669.1 hypothetical protein HBI09_166080 [Parastagonospora nodorum]KAH4050878.1 hypothetical protein HBH49_124700 [Parastagonospora nodorum]
MPRQFGQQRPEPRDFIDLTGETPQYRSSHGVPVTSQQPAYMAHPGYPSNNIVMHYQPDIMVPGHMHGMQSAQRMAMYHQPVMMYHESSHGMQPTNIVDIQHDYSRLYPDLMHSTQLQFHSHSQQQQTSMPDPGNPEGPQHSFHAMTPIPHYPQTFLPQQQIRHQNGYLCDPDGRVECIVARETNLPGSKILPAMTGTRGVRAPPGNKKKREHRDVSSPNSADSHMVHGHNNVTRSMRSHPTPESESTHASRTTSNKQRRMADLPAPSNEGLLKPDQTGSQTSEAPRSAEPTFRGGAGTYDTEIRIPRERKTMATKGPREPSWSSKLQKSNLVPPVEDHEHSQQLSWIETGESATRQLEVDYPAEALYAMDQGHPAPTPTKAQSETPQLANSLSTFLRLANSDANSDAISTFAKAIIEENIEKNLANDRSIHIYLPSQQDSSLSQTLLEKAEIEPEFLVTYYRTRCAFDPLHPDHILNMDNVVFGNDFLDYGPEAKQQAANFFEETLGSGGDLGELGVLSRS